MSFEPSLARRGLDKLLALHPHFDVLVVEDTVEERVFYLGVGEGVQDGIPLPVDGPWIVVTLGQRSEGPTRAYAIHNFAIWRSTGAVHSMHEGAVSDDPIFTP